MSVIALFAGTLISVAASPVAGQSGQIAISVPASAGDLAVNRLAAQAGVSIVLATDLRGRRTALLSGRFTVDEAFRRLLTPVGARAVRIGPGVYRVEAQPGPRPPAATAPMPRDAGPTQLDEVVVTAPVGRGVLDGVSGRSVHGEDAITGVGGRTSIDALTTLSAAVDSTRQGTGRNKLFVRGVADSALSGPLQATIGQYLGDFRLNFGVPDPDLPLVDIRRIDVFEGPQGSRFGAGSIGGVIRFELQPPDPDVSGGLFSAAASATLQGAPGSDASLILNQPVGERAAVRAVVYGRRDGGFVDNTARSDDADSIDVLGGRLAYRLTGDRWTLDLLAMSQGVAAADTPLTTDPGRLESDRDLAQPYEGRHSLVGAALSRRGSGFRMTTAVSASRQSLAETFDASIPQVGLAAVTTRLQETEAVSFETRAEVDLGPAWRVNAGASLAQAETQSTRTLLRPEIGVRPLGQVEGDRTFREAAVFGEMVIRPTASLSLVLGGRMARVRIVNRITAHGSGPGAVGSSDNADAFVTPSVGLSWTPPWGGQLFGRYEEGVRPGDVGEVQGFARPYGPDRVRLLEAGAASPPNRTWRLEGSAGLVDWRDIQSDTITVGGDLVTDNIGDGRIVFVRLNAAWNPSDDLRFSGGLFLNRSELRLGGPSLIGVPEGDLPNVAPVSGRVGVEYGPIPLGAQRLSLSAHMRYIGRSTPGLGPGLDEPQGGYMDTSLSARLEADRHAVVFSISNPFDVSATRFAIGAPYRLYEGGVVPLRPMTVRFGIEARF